MRSFSVTLLLCLGAVTANNALSRSIRIINQSFSDLGVYWVHPTTGETVAMSPEPLAPGGEFPLNSYVGHTFEMRETPKAGSTMCSQSPDKTCRRAEFQVSENQDQLVSINQDIEVQFVDSKLKAKESAADLVSACRARATSALASNIDEAQVLDLLTECVEGGIAQSLEKVSCFVV